MKKKSVLSLLLAAIMLLSLLAGCGETAAEPTQAPATQAPATQAPTTPDDPAEPVSVYPLTEGDPLEFTCFFGVGNFVTSKLPNEDFNEIAAIKRANEVCNVWLDVSSFDDTFYKEQFYIMVAGGELPDMVITPEKIYTGGVEALINDEVCIDLVPYFEEYMPNYYAKVYSTDDLYAKQITSDEGHVTTVWGRSDFVNHGSMIRKDWLDDLNLEVPTTYDELHDVLTAFKTEKNADMAFMRASSILYLSHDSSFVGGYDNLTACAPTTDVPWVIGDDGKVICSYMKPSFQGYVQMLADWFEEGLFSEDAFTQDVNPTEWFPYIYQNRCGYWTGTTTSLSNTFRETVDDPNCEIIPMADVTLNEGDTIDVGNSRGILGDGGWAVTTQCEQVEEVCRYMDWFFTDEGYTITNYGTEGVSYYIDDAGQYQFTDLILANENGWSVQASFAIYATYMQNPSDRCMWSKAATLDESARTCFEVWVANRSEDKVCQGVLSSEETEIYNEKVGDMATYAGETLLAMVHGDIDVAQGWPEFVAQMESMGVNELTKLKQAAYDRYMAR